MLSRPTKPVSRPTLCLAEQLTRCLLRGRELGSRNVALDLLAGDRLCAGLAPRSRGSELLLEAWWSQTSVALLVDEWWLQLDERAA